MYKSVVAEKKQEAIKGCNDKLSTIYHKMGQDDTRKKILSRKGPYNENGQ